MYYHDEAAGGERDLAIRPLSERDDRDREVDPWRYDQGYRLEREYERESRSPASRPVPPRRQGAAVNNHSNETTRQGPGLIVVQEVRSPYSPSREDDYQIIHHAEALDDRQLARRDRGYDYHDERSLYRREISPQSSVSVYRGHRAREYSSDDDMVYVRPSRDYREGSPHHKRHIAEGAIVGIGAAEALQYFQKRRGDPAADTMTRFSKDFGGGALGAVAGGMLSRARSRRRSKSRRRTESLDRGRSQRYHHHRHRSRSSSHSRVKMLTSLALGATALAGTVALVRKKSQKESEREIASNRSSHGRRSRSRRRRGSSPSSGTDDTRSASRRNKAIAGAGLAGAAVAGLVQKARSKSRSRRDRSHSRIRASLPIVATALGTAGIAALHQKNKAKNQEGKSDRGRRRSRSRSISRSRSRSRNKSRQASFADFSQGPAGLIEYGDEPLQTGVGGLYGRPISQEGYYQQAIEPDHGRRHSRDRRRHRDRSYSRSGSSVSERESKGRHRHRRKSRSRSRSGELATAAGLAAGAAGLAAHEYTKNKGRRGKAEKDRQRHESERSDQDPYEEQYNPAYLSSPSPSSGPPYPQGPYYPQANNFPPPPGPTPAAPINQPAPFNSNDYPPPPPGPPLPQNQQYQFPSSPASAPDPYAPRPYRGEENVSAVLLPTPSAEQRHMSSDGLGPAQRQPLSAGPNHAPGSQQEAYPSVTVPELAAPSAPKPRPRSVSQPAAKTVQFDLGSDRSRSPLLNPVRDPGYETDDSDSSADFHEPPRDRRRRHHHHHHRRRPTSESRRSLRKPSSSRRGQPGQDLASYRGDVRPSDYNPTSPPHEKTDRHSGSDSESTIDLPDRFDSEGDPMPESEDDQLAEGLLKFLNVTESFLLNEQDRLRNR